MNWSGKIITFEGTNGAGKSTQAKLFVDELTRRGQKVHFIKYPQYETPTGALIGRYLKGEFGPKEELFEFSAFLFAADRAKNKQLYRDLLSQGYVIVHDRYRESNWGIQTALFEDHKVADQKLNWLIEMEKDMYASDVVIYLHMPTDMSVELMKSRQQLDKHEQDKAFMLACERRYGELASRFGWCKVECLVEGRLKSKEVIFGEILQLLKLNEV